MSIRVCIADDHLLILTAVRRALEEAQGLDVLAITQRGDEVLAMVDEHRPDLLLLDQHMPGLDGIACLKLVRAAHPDVRVVMLSASEDPTKVAEALECGASAYIGKRIDPDDLAPALRQIVAGVVHQSSPRLRDAARPEADAASELTDRELTMLKAISRGLSTKAISGELWVSEKTVKFHLTNVYRKLGVHNRTGAMRLAIERGLVPAPSSSESDRASTA